MTTIGGRLVSYSRAFTDGTRLTRIPPGAVDWNPSRRVTIVRNGDHRGTPLGHVVQIRDRAPTHVEVDLTLRERYADEIADEVRNGYVPYLRPILIGARGHFAADGTYEVESGRLAFVSLEGLDLDAGQIEHVDRSHIETRPVLTSGPHRRHPTTADVLAKFGPAPSIDLTPTKIRRW